VRTEAEVRAQVSLPVLATIPKVNGEEKLVMLNAQASAAAEAYRGLRSSVQHLSSDSDPYVLLMTGPVPHEGKSITAANLAIAFALAGQRVILVDADMHRPVQHRLFRLPNTAGLSTALVDWDFDVDSVLQVTNVPNLRLLASGPLPPSPAELLSSDRMQALIAELQSFADIIILDSPPVTAVADATVLSTYAHGVILVLRANKSRRNKAKRAVETLRQVDAPLLGAILNDVAKHSSAYSHSDYGYRFNTGAPGSSTASNVPPNVPPDSAHRRQNGAPQPRRARRTSIIPRSRRLTSSGETERLHREP
jgi:capsular exopolysaccharide synthesis family protein